MSKLRTPLDHLMTKVMASLHAMPGTFSAQLAAWRTHLVSLRTVKGWQEVWRTVWPLLAYATAWVLAYFATVVQGLALSPKIEGPSPLHFEDAVTVAALLLTPPRRWWLYLLLIIPLTVMDFWWLGLPPSASVVWVTLAGLVVIGGVAVLTVSLLRRFAALPLRFASVGEVSRLVACAAVAAAPAAFLATSLRTFVFSWNFWASWQVAYLGHVLGIVVFTPAIVLWLTVGPRGLGLTTQRRQVELVLLGLTTLAVSGLVFGTRLTDVTIAHTLIYVLVPLLLWAAIRFGPQGLASVLTLTAALAITGAVNDRGPFVGASATANTLALQLFLLFVAVPLYVLAALVHERTAAVSTLQESETRFRTLADQAPVLIWMSGPDSLCTFFNAVWLAFRGRTLEQEQGTGWVEGVHPDDKPQCLETYVAAFTARRPFEMEYRLRRHDGVYRWIVDRGIPRFAPGGRFEGYIGSALDITERKETEGALHDSEARYQAVVETQTELITRYQPDLTLTFVNDATCRFDGKSREELLGTSMVADVPPEAATRVRAMVEGLLAQPDPGIVTIEHEVRGPDGRLLWTQWVNRTILDADGQVVELQGIGRDITERKQMEEQLRASRARYRSVVRTLPQTAVLLFDAELRHSFAEGPGLQLVGLTPQELEGRTLSEAFPVDLAAALAPLYGAALSGRETALDVGVEVAHAQHIFYVQAVPIASAERDPAVSGVTALTALAAAPASTPALAPAPVGMVVLQDVTEQRHARDELERERLLTTMLGALSMEFRTLADHSPDGIGRLDPAGRLLYINQAAEELLGMPAEQWVGKTFAELDMGQGVYEPWVQALREVLETRAPLIFDAEAPAPDGRVRSLHTRLIPELAADGTLQSVLGIATDVSALKQAEAHLAEQANELETIFESQADGVGVYDLDGHVVRANRALRDLLGLDADPAYTALPIEERAQRLRLYDEQGETVPLEQWPQWRVLRGEILAGARAMEVGVRTLDGRDRWLSITGAPLQAADGRRRGRERGPGEATGVVLIARDVTARRTLERQVTEQAAELEAIFEAQADGVLVYDKDGHMVRANRAWQAMFQAFADLNDWSADSTFAALPFAEQAEWWHEAVRGREYALRDVDGHAMPLEQTPTYRALHGETLTGANAMDERVDGADGRVYVVSVSAAPIRDAEGAIVGAVGVSRDVTAQRQLERQVREQANELETIFETQADGVAVYDLAGRCVRANAALRALLGLAADDREFTARPLHDRDQRLALFDERGQPLPQEQWPLSRVLHGEILAGVSTLETGARTVDGRELWISTTGAPLRAADGSGQVRGAVLIARDVTARRALERQVAEQAAELAAIFEAQADVVVVYDQQGRFVRGNRAWEAFFHQHADLRGLSTQAAVIALPVEDQVAWVNQQIQDADGQLIPVEDRPTARALQGETVTGLAAVDEWYQLADGRDLLLSVSAAPMRDGEGGITGVVVVGRDVTARRQLERQVQEQAAQLEATFEAMTDGIAVLDVQGHATRINPAAQALFKLAKGEERALRDVEPTAGERAQVLDLRDLTGQPVSSALAPSARLLRGEVLSGANALTLQFGPRDGRERIVSFTGGPMRDAASGQIVGAVLVARDVTELQRVQVALAEQERLFRTLVENSPDIIARFDRQQRYLYVNPAIRQVSPLPETDYIGKTNAELGWPEAAYAPAHRAIEQVFQTGQPQTLEEGTRAADAGDASDTDTAATQFFQARILPERAEDGLVESVLTVTTDVTTLKRTEQALLTANSRLETARQEEARRTQIAESLRGVLSMLNSKRAPREVLQYIVRQAEELLGSAAAVIYGPAQLSETISSAAEIAALRVQATEGLRVGGRRPQRQHQRLPFADRAMEQVLASGQPVTLVAAHGLPRTASTVDSAGEAEDAEAEEHAKEAQEAAADADIAHLTGELPTPYHALLVVPIRVHDGLYGCLLLFYPEPHRFGADEVALAQAYADQVAQAITNARLQLQLEQEATTAERTRIAQELHDTVKQELYSASLVAQSLPTVWQTRRTVAEAALRQLHAMTQSAYAGLEALLLELRPTALEQLPLAESLRQLGAAMSLRAGVPIAVEADRVEEGEGVAAPAPETPVVLPAAVKVVCYRIAQEALMNVAKYAHAHTIRVRLRTQKLF